MKKLKKINSRPRENRKSTQFLLSLQLDIDNSSGDAIEDLKKFKEWVTNIFTKWDKSILEYFLYQYGLLQNENSDKYSLDFKVEKLLKDDTMIDAMPVTDENLLKKLKENNEDV